MFLHNEECQGFVSPFNPHQGFWKLFVGGKKNNKHKHKEKDPAWPTHATEPVARLVVKHLPGEAKAKTACYISSANRAVLQNEDMQVLKHTEHKGALSFLGAIIFK